MVRIVFALLIWLAASPVIAATVTRGPETWSAASQVETPFYAQILSSQDQAYRDSPGPTPAFVPGVVGYVLLVALYAGCVVRAAPGRSGWRYVWAAAATSRIRWTIARNPFERWAER